MNENILFLPQMTLREVGGGRGGYRGHHGSPLKGRGAIEGAMGVYLRGGGL